MFGEVEKPCKWRVLVDMMIEMRNYVER